MKKIGGIFLAVLLLCVTGCGNAEKAEDNREKEIATSLTKTELELPTSIDEVESIVQSEDDSILLLAAENEHHEGSVWKSDQSGENWECQYKYTDYLPEEIKENAEDYEIKGTLAADGSIYCIVYDVSDIPTVSDGSYDIPRKTYKISGQTCEELEIGMPKDGTRDSIDEIYVSASGNLFASDGIQIFAIDSASGDIKYSLRERDYSDSLWYSYYATENEMYVLTESGIDCYDIVSGEKTEESEEIRQFNQKYTELVKSYGYSDDDCMNNNYYINQKLYVDDSDTSLQIVVADINGVYLYKSGELEFGAKAESALTQDASNLDLITEIQNHLWLAYYDSGDGKAHLNQYSEEKSSVTIDTQLTLYTLKNDSSVQKVIAAYENKHPNVKITVQNGVSGEDGVTTSDAIKLLNTNMLAGDGPDLILLDGLPVNDYVEKNMLIDLNGVLDSVTENSEMFDSVARTYQSGDAVYAIPGRFAMMFAGGTESLDDTDLEEIQNLFNYEQNDSYKGDLYSHMATILYRTYFDSDDITSDKIAQFYENLQMLNSQCDEAFTKSTGMELYQLLKSQSLEVEDMGDTARMYAGADRMLGYILSTEDLQIIYGNANTDNPIQTKLLTKDEKLLYVPMHVFGISATSRNQEAAEDFLKYYLSEDGQKTDSSAGITVNRSSLMSQLESMDNLEMSLSEDDNHVSLVIDSLNDAQAAEVLAVLDEAAKATDDNDTVFEILMEQVVNYLDGSSELEQAAADAYQKINLYLAE